MMTPTVFQAVPDFLATSPQDLKDFSERCVLAPLLEARSKALTLGPGETLRLIEASAKPTNVLLTATESTARRALLTALRQELSPDGVHVPIASQQRGLAFRPILNSARQPSFDWQDRQVIVTGASSGLGRATSLKLAERGATVFALARRIDRLKELESKATAGRIIAITADMADELSIHNAIATSLTHAVEPHFDGIVHCAGSNQLGLIAKTSQKELEGLVATNVLGTLLFIRAALPYAATNAHIAIVASGVALFPCAGTVAYSTVKAAQFGFSAALTKALQHTQIKITSVLPGFFKSEMLHKNYDLPLMEGVVRLMSRTWPESDGAAKTMLRDTEQGLAFSAPGLGGPQALHHPTLRAFLSKSSSWTRFLF